MLEGKVMKTSGVVDTIDELSGSDEGPKALPIVVVNDSLRRTFVPKLHLAEMIDEAREQPVRIKLWQNVAQSGGAVGSVGPSLGITAFDKYGRRVYEMQTRDGPLAVVQGITELTHRYAKVESLLGPKRKIVWDMRLATSSIPRATLQRILDTAVAKDNPDARLQVVRFYLQGERYQDARRELNEIIRRFPEKQELRAEARSLRQMGARRVLREIELRRAAGQHELVSRLLSQFPAEEVAGETLQQVREMSTRYEHDTAQIVQVCEHLKIAAAAIADDDHRRLVEPIVAEITENLSHNTIDRLVPFAQLVDDDDLSPDQKTALAVSGWLLGGENATQELSKAVSLLSVRKAVLKYLREPMVHQRELLLESVSSLEGASVESVADLLAHIVAPWEIPSKADRQHGAYELFAPGSHRARRLSLPRTAAARVRSVSPLPDNSGAERSLQFTAAGARFLGRFAAARRGWRCGWTSQRSGNAARVHYDLSRLAQTAAVRIRVFVSRTRSGARLPARCKSTLRYRYQPCLSLGPWHRWRCRLGSSSGAPRCLGRCNSFRRHGSHVYPSLLGERPACAALLRCWRAGWQENGRQRFSVEQIFQGVSQWSIQYNGCRISWTRTRAVSR